MYSFYVRYIYVQYFKHLCAQYIINETISEKFFKIFKEQLRITQTKTSKF